MALADDVRLLFPYGRFGPPCNDEQIATAERALGHKLPPMIEQLYRAFDGFTGPTEAQFFYPLLETSDPMKASLVPYTSFLRGEEFPGFLHRTIAIGDQGTGPCWLIEVDKPGRLLWWDAEWEDYDVVSGTLLDAWRDAKARHERLDSGEQE